MNRPVHRLHMLNLTISDLTAFTAALLLCGASLPAAEVTITAPDSPMLRFAECKLEAALQQRGDTLKRVSNPAPGQTAMLSVTIDPAAAGGVRPEGFRLARLRDGEMIAGGGERGRCMACAMSPSRSDSARP